MIVFDSDDFGCNHEISDMCQSHDCRDVLLKFKKTNPAFKATLFTIPGETTYEIAKWASETNWVELAVHGFYHTSNYECEKMSYEEFDTLMHTAMNHHLLPFFVKGFKAPGWQISDDIYKWLKDHNWWIADQSYNDERRPIDLPVYIIGDNSLHTHTWNCVGNGVYELFDDILERIKDETDFRFVSEVV